MAHHRSAKKRIRQTEKRTLVNRARTSRIRGFIKKVELAVAGGDAEAAKSASVAEPEPSLRSRCQERRSEAQHSIQADLAAHPSREPDVCD